MEGMGYIKSVFLTAGVMMLFGCANEVPGRLAHGYNDSSHTNFIYHGHNFGPDRNAEYQRGVKDGCVTADGDYTKDHEAYRMSESYHVGWDHGRLHCKGNEA